MKKNDHHWIRRILVCTVIFCLTATSFGAQPVQASPPAMSWSNLMVLLYPPSGGTICLNQEFDMIGKFMYQVYLTSKNEGEWARPSDETARLVQVDIKAKSGTVDPKRLFINTVGYNKWESFNFKYKATTQTKLETITVKVSMGKFVVEETTEFPVKKCDFNIHGSADIGKAVNAMVPDKAWDFVGTYDISGTLKANEDGSLRGQGVANRFTDALWTGEGADVEGTCQHMNPWEGMTTIEIEADPNAWANEGVLNLKFTIQPMQINTTRVVCEGPTTYGYADSPPITVGLFDLNFDGLPADGGSTSLDFQFPSGRGEFEMDLNVTPVEEGGA